MVRKKKINALWLYNAKQTKTSQHTKSPQIQQKAIFCPPWSNSESHITAWFNIADNINTTMACNCLCWSNNAVKQGSFQALTPEPSVSFIIFAAPPVLFARTRSVFTFPDPYNLLHSRAQTFPEEGKALLMSPNVPFHKLVYVCVCSSCHLCPCIPKKNDAENNANDFGTDDECGWTQGREKKIYR